MASSLPSRILFGSCNNQNLTQPLWPVIESRKAAAFVWGGDAIYAGEYRSEKLEWPLRHAVGISCVSRMFCLGLVFIVRSLAVSFCSGRYKFGDKHKWVPASARIQLSDTRAFRSVLCHTA